MAPRRELETRRRARPQLAVQVHPRPGRQPRDLHRAAGGLEEDRLEAVIDEIGDLDSQLHRPVTLSAQGQQPLARLQAVDQEVGGKRVLGALGDRLAHRQHHSAHHDLHPGRPGVQAYDGARALQRQGEGHRFAGRDG